jgi:predicted O-linked N-acetylglucosamine transferase (SPINDLY family)
MDVIEARFADAVGRHQSGDTAGAERLYREVLQNAPNHTGALCNLGVILARTNPAEAEKLYTAAIAANPNLLDARFNLGNLYRKLNRPQDALGCYQAALRIDPQNARAYLNLGLAAGDVGDLDAAIECFRKAVSLDRGIPDAFNLLGDSLHRAGRNDEAIAVFREFIVRCPDDARAHHNLALALASRGDYDDAVPELELALRVRPNYPEANNTLGVVLEALKRADEAQTHYKTATEQRPDYPEAWSNLGTSYMEQGRVPEAIEALRKSLGLRADSRTADNLLLTLGYTSDTSPERLRDEHIAWAEKYAANLAPAEPPRITGDPNRRLKIGYVSADFRQHTVSGFIETLLAHHDRNQFHVTCYANSAQSDEVTERMKRSADAWRPIAGMLDVHAAELIRNDGIDILVDLSGHTAGNRLLLFARKPAPIQATLFGYPLTTGLATIDYRITDPLADPPGETEAFNTEALLRLPEVAWTYRPSEDAPPINALPSQSRRTFTFGCMNNPAKLSAACVVAWVNVLKAVPRSRLVLLAGRSAVAARATAERFTSLGIAPDRLELVYRLPPNEYFEAYQPIDLALDPFPYNGGVTTCDALWMGVPVLTVAGRDYRSRQGVSILNNVGLPEFVADSPAKLVELASIWSEQRDALSDLRTSLREMMEASPVTQGERYVRHLESALREVVSARSASMG